MTVGIDTDFLVRLSLIEHVKHRETCELRDFHIEQGDKFGLTPQVISEFVHVVTDARRFDSPLEIQTALEISQQWWNADDVVRLYPGESSTELFFRWMGRHKLGRKRILDTQLAAICIASDVKHLITGNASDYRIFSDLKLIEM